MRKGWPKSHLGYEEMSVYTKSPALLMLYIFYINFSSQSLIQCISSLMSMVGRKTLGQVDRHLRQIFPQHGKEVFGGSKLMLSFQ